MPDKPPPNVNSWSQRSEWETAALCVMGVGLLLILVALSSDNEEMGGMGFLIAFLALCGFLFANARRTKRNRAAQSKPRTDT